MHYKNQCLFNIVVWVIEVVYCKYITLISLIIKVRENRRELLWEDATESGGEKGENRASHLKRKIKCVYGMWSNLKFE